jgi:hypothetical protein
MSISRGAPPNKSQRTPSVHLLNPKQSPQKIDIRFSSISFVLLQFRVFLSDGSSKAVQFCFAKKSCRKDTQNNRQKSKTDVFSVLCYHVFERFSVRGVQNHHKKRPREFNFEPGPFSLASDRPTHHGSHRICFFAAPCRAICMMRPAGY